MGKKKRLRKHTVFGYLEGDREIAFIEFLKEIYQPQLHNISFQTEPSSGGTPDKMIGAVLRECHRDRCFVWLDEDFEPDTPLSKIHKEKLASCWNLRGTQREKCLQANLATLPDYNPQHRNPILIVSKPVCAESLLLQITGNSMPYHAYFPERREKQIADLKNAFNQVTGKEDINYYRTHLTLEVLETRKAVIPLLQLLISMVQGL